MLKQQNLEISIAIRLILLSPHSAVPLLRPVRASQVADPRMAAEGTAEWATEDTGVRMGMGSKRQRRMSTVKADLGKKKYSLKS